MSLLPVELPEFNRPVRAMIKYFDNWKTKDVIMVAVDEDDCSWRLADDNCELAYEWDVIYWEYINAEQNNDKP